jgi:hypothetical protein
MCLEYHIFHHPGPTFILIGVPLRALHRWANNGECLKMVLGHQEFSTSFTRAVNHVTEDELEEDLLQRVMATTLEEELSLPCLDDVANYFSLAEEEAEYQDMEQEVKPETSPVELKQLPPGLMMRGWFPIFHEVELGRLGEISMLVKKAPKRRS